MYSRLLRKAVSVMLRVVSCIIILSSILLLYLGYFGLPSSLINSKLDFFQSKFGMRVEIENVVIRPDGWVIHSVDLYGSNSDQLVPLFFIDSIHIGSLNPFRAWQRREPLFLEYREIVFADCDMNFWNEKEIPRQIELLRTQLVAKNNQLSFESGEVISKDSSLLFSGCIDPAVLETPLTEARLPDSFSKVVDTWESGPISIDAVVQFSITDSDWKNWNIDSFVFLTSLRLFGSDFDSVELQMKLADQQIRVEKLECIHSDQSIHLAGSYQFKDQLVELSGIGDIDLCSFDFDFALKQIELWESRGLLIDSIPTYSFQMGPAQLDEIGENIVFDLEAEITGVSDLRIKPIKIEGSRKNGLSKTHIRNVKLSSHENDSIKLGHLDFLFYDNLETLSNQLILQLSIHPELLKELSFLKESMRPLFTRFRSEDPEGLLKINLVRNEEKHQVSQWKGSICGNYFHYNDVYFDQINSDFVWQDRQLTLSNFRGNHEDQYVMGDVKIDFSDSLFDGNLESYFSLNKMKKILDVENKFIDDSLDLVGNSQLLFQGKLRWEPFDEADFTLEMKADNCRLYAQEIENFNCRLTGINQKIIVEHLLGNWSGGSVALEGIIPYDHSHVHGWIMGVCKLTDISLAQLTKNQVDAILNANGTFRYNTSRPLVASMRAEIDLEIMGDRLAGLPVLKELSEFVSTVWNPLDLFAIDQLEGDLKWNKNQVEVGRLEMSGPIFAGEFDGLYDFENGYDAMLQLHFSHDNNWKRMLHILTKPFLRVLDLNLSGSVENPSWSLRNIDQVIR